MEVRFKLSGFMLWSIKGIFCYIMLSMFMKIQYHTAVSCNKNTVLTVMHIKITVVPLYPLNQYLWFQLSAVHHGMKKKIGKLRNKHFQNMHQAKMGCNMVKSSSPNTPSTWLIFLCPRTHAKMSESLTFISTSSIQYTLLLLYLMLVMSYCA
jgi:hypothetical protein